MDPQYVASQGDIGDGTSMKNRMDIRRRIIVAGEAGATAIPVTGGAGTADLGTVQPYSQPGSRWAYAAANLGIANTTTAVTIKAAAGAAVKNYITSLQIVSEALGAATEVAIRDGAGGAVLWRIKIGTGGLIGGFPITFPSPLVGTANTLLEVVTLTASVTGAVYVNAQGYTAA